MPDRPRPTTGSTKLRQQLSDVRGSAVAYARKLGCTRGHLWNLAHARKKPSRSMAAKLQHLFKIRPEEWDA